ncbi:Maf family protein, partial [Clostridiaceae bacterium HSG29]|nr:Maf family protein [Clostridiaceae bacterium HSG29]
VVGIMKFILASNSPRRKEILNMLNIDYIQTVKDTKEKIDSSISPKNNAMAIAFEKAMVIAEEYPDKTVIAADTIVVIDGHILGKPVDSEDALKMLKMLNNREHFVYSGIALININRNIKIVDYEETNVIFKNNSINTLKNYILSGEPFGKAGAYAIQGIGTLLVENFNGCFFNVIGLPINKLNSILIKHFNYYIL